MDKHSPFTKLHNTKQFHTRVLYSKNQWIGLGWSHITQDVIAPYPFPSFWVVQNLDFTATSQSSLDLLLSWPGHSTSSPGLRHLGSHVLRYFPCFSAVALTQQLSSWGEWMVILGWLLSWWWGPNGSAMHCHDIEAGSGSVQATVIHLDTGCSHKQTTQVHTCMTSSTRTYTRLACISCMTCAPGVIFHVSVQHSCKNLMHEKAFWHSMAERYHGARGSAWLSAVMTKRGCVWLLAAVMMLQDRNVPMIDNCPPPYQ